MTTYRPHLCLLAVLLIFPTLLGCSPLNLAKLTSNLNRQTDLELVCEGAPAYLLLLDSLLTSDPTNPKLLQGGIQAYTSYAGAVKECGHPERAAVMVAKSRSYGLTLLRTQTGITPEMSFEDLEKILAHKNQGDIGPLFWGGYGWALWVSQQDGSPAALAELPKIELLMQRVNALDDTFSHGGAHLFLGIYNGARPALYGGNPELARQHFEQALASNQRAFLPVQVAYAEYYAKPLFDRELYQKLLTEVLAFDPATAPELTLSNLVAQRQARRLLEKIDENF
ncbi:MAG: hypothetical protein HGA96_14495 [Desulfobulbaceae bacterium]|nr:hypothetical protein [Desulfobulbaceae bacterium]